LFLEFVPERWSIDLAALLIEIGYGQVLRTPRKAAFELK
jgi:hypothetical protein